MKNSSLFPFSIVVGMSENRVIGAKGGLPWHLPEDLKWFKSLTLGHAVIMGRKTYESIGRPLPKRRNVVVSRQKITIPEVEVVSDLFEIQAQSPEQKLFLIGGGELYRLGLPKSAEIFLTRVKRNVEGDTTFPEFESEFQLLETLREDPLFTIEHWRRRENGELRMES